MQLKSQTVDDLSPVDGGRDEGLVLREDKADLILNVEVVGGTHKSDNSEQDGVDEDAVSRLLQKAIKVV